MTITHTLQTLDKNVHYWVRLIFRDRKIDYDAKVKTERMVLSRRGSYGQTDVGLSFDNNAKAEFCNMQLSCGGSYDQIAFKLSFETEAKVKQGCRV